MRAKRPALQQRDRAVAAGPSQLVVGRRLGLARRLSKLGVCSRSEAERRIRGGRVSVGSRVVNDPEHPTVDGGPQITIDGIALVAVERCCLMLNKPRGLTTTTADERGRETVYACLADPQLPWLAPVGRLDRASEGLLLFSNDPQWANAVTASGGEVTKTYHVRIDRVADTALLQSLRAGVEDRGDELRVLQASALATEQGQRRRWIELVLNEGRNRHIRRMLAALGVDVERLIRVAIGPLQLGGLAKGQWRRLSQSEADSLAPSIVLRQ